MLTFRALAWAGVAITLAATSSQARNSDDSWLNNALPSDGAVVAQQGEEMPTYWEGYETEDFSDMSFSELQPLSMEALGEETDDDDFLTRFFMDDKEKCVTCVKKTGFKVMCYTIKKVKAYCAKTKCPRLKKYCKILDKHPQFAYGFIWEKVHPMSLGAAYCCGHGECRGPNVTELMENEEDVITSSVKAFLADAVEDVKQDLQSDEDALALDDDKGKKCKDCIHHGIAAIMHRVWDRVNKYCSKTKDPRVKKMCELIKTHKEVITGFLFGYVEPWKFAIGYCVGNKKCKHHHEEAGGALQEVVGVREEESRPVPAISSLFEWS